MDYRSPFELRQQLLEESRSASPSASSKPSLRGKGGTGNGAAAHNALLASGGSGGGGGTAFMPSTSLPDDPTALVREVPGAENLKALSAALEREEAVQRYMESANLTLEDSVTYIMGNGSTAQKMSFFAHVRDSLVDLNQKRVSKVLSILLDSMWAQDPELQCRAPEYLLGLIGVLSSSTAAEVFDVTQTMLTVKTAEVRIAWGKLLLGLLSCLDAVQLEKRMISLAVAKSEHAEPQDQRELSCQLLGGLCEYVPKDKVEQLILPRAIALCQDTNIGVRQRMCQQLSTIAHSLGVENAKAKVAPDLLELLNDEERAVSRAAFSCLLDLVEFFGAEYRKERLYPIIMRYVSNPPAEVTSLLVVDYGRLLDKIKGDISNEEDVELLASFFEKAAARGDEDARRNCAFNFPAVAASLPLSVFSSHLSPCLNKLANDIDVCVRCSVAAGLHELVGLLCDQAATFLEKPFLLLLKDRDRNVRACFFRHVDVLLDCLSQQVKGTAARRVFFGSVAETILMLAPACKSNWRDIQKILRIMDSYSQHFDESIITDSFTPLVLSLAKDGAAVLKNDCAILLVHFIALITNPTTKSQLCCRMNNEFARSGSCYHRQFYLLFARECCRAFSQRFARERLLECCFEFQRDGVPSVRLLLARTLPFLCKGLKTKCPGAAEEEFNNMLQRLLMDTDPSVREAAATSKSLMERIEKERRSRPKKVEEEEAEDQLREKAEQPMLDLAKECDKAERRAKLRDLLKSEREKEMAESSMSWSASSSRKVAPVGERGGVAPHLLVSPARKKSGKVGTSSGAQGGSPAPPVALPRLPHGKAGGGLVPTSLGRKRV